MASELSATGAGVAPASGGPTGLMCDLVAFPSKTVLRNPEPSFSWIVNDAGRDTIQKAYQIQVASDLQALNSNKPDLWDSGQVMSDHSSGVRYAGMQLNHGSSFCWRVRCWSTNGKISAYSEPQSVRTAFLLPPGITSQYEIEITPVRPVRIVRTGEGSYFIDFGKAAFGRLKLKNPADIKGMVALGEALKAENSLNPMPGGSIRYKSYAAGSPAIVDGTVPPASERQMPFRYVEVTGFAAKPTEGDFIHLTEHYPFDDNASRFQSSDKTLNAIWDLCKYSMKATSFMGVYIDGDRERKPYEADAYINQLGHYSVDREYTLARHSFEYLLEHPTWPTEWQPHMVFMAWTDYLYTGDDRILRQRYDEIKARTLLQLAGDDGLISTKRGLVTKPFLAAMKLPRIEDIVDWPLGERDGYKFGPINTVVNAFHYRSLILMAQIAEAIGKRDDASDLKRRAERVYRAFNELLFDPKQGLYRDAADNDHASLHANMFPLAFGLVPAERKSKVVEFVKSRGMACSVYAAQYLLEALYQAGEGKYALDLMLETDSDRSWAHMLKVGTTITLEAWDNKYKPNQDWNHAWGAAPANIIPRCLMGIEPTLPGWKRMRIAPQLGSLTQAEITVPTIRGSVSVAVTRQANSHTVSLELPANTRADLVLPVTVETEPKVSTVRKGDTTTVNINPANPNIYQATIDGKQMRFVVKEGHILIAGIGSGKHTIKA